MRSSKLNSCIAAAVSSIIFALGSLVLSGKVGRPKPIKSALLPLIFELIFLGLGVVHGRFQVLDLACQEIILVARDRIVVIYKEEVWCAIAHYLLEDVQVDGADVWI
jgi:hypothetical protein